MCSWILMSIEYQIITLSLCLGSLSLCGVKFPSILFHNVHNVSWMVLPMFSISHSHMGEYSWQWPCQCSQWYFQCSWVILPILLVFHDVLLILLFLTSNCCSHVRGWCFGSNNLNTIDGPTSCQGAASEEGGKLSADANRRGGQHKVEDHLLPGRPVFHQPSERFHKVEKLTAERSLNDNEYKSSGDLPDARHDADGGDGQASRDSKCHRH